MVHSDKSLLKKQDYDSPLPAFCLLFELGVFFVVINYIYSKQDKKTLKRILQLLKDIERNGYDGIGKPEQLSGDLAAYWSRRIDDANRIVYRIEGNSE